MKRQDIEISKSSVLEWCRIGAQPQGSHPMASFQLYSKCLLTTCNLTPLFSSHTYIESPNSDLIDLIVSSGKLAIPQWLCVENPYFIVCLPCLYEWFEYLNNKYHVMNLSSEVSHLTLFNYVWFLYELICIFVVSINNVEGNGDIALCMLFCFSSTLIIW